MTRFLPSDFTTHSTRASPWGEAVGRILCASLEAVDPQVIVERNLRLHGDRLQVGKADYDLKYIGRVLLFGLGKASAAMASAAAGILGNRLAGGLVITKDGHARGIALPPHVHLFESGHPIPDGRSLLAAKLTSEFLANLQPIDLVICLISGGGSALCVSPSPGISLEDLRKLNAALLACGAEIDEINTVRKHLETIKGGGFVLLAAPARVSSLILSDVMGDALDQIASGITAPDPTTFGNALQVLQRYSLPEEDHSPIYAHLRRGASGEINETLKPGNPVFKGVQHTIIANNHLAAQAAVQQAQEEGFNSLLLAKSLRGEAREAGRFLASIASQVKTNGYPLPRPACLVAGGETTVTIRGDGLGGRNQELALGAVADLSRLTNVALVTLATDGDDGPTDAAGAVITGETKTRALQAGMSPEDYLARNDAYHFFEALGDLIKIGPTLTNVNDLALVFAS